MVRRCRCHHGERITSGIDPSMTSVPQVSIGENQNGSCIRTNAATPVAIRFCQST